MARAACPAVPTAPTLVRLAVERAPECLAGEGARVRAVVQQHLAVDDHIIDPHRTLPHMHLSPRKLMDGLTRRGANGVRIEESNIRGLARGDEAPVMQIMHQRGLARHPID